MSTDLAVIKGTGKERNLDLQITQFYGGVDTGLMLQLTQKIEGTQSSPRYIQLAYSDVMSVRLELEKWCDSQWEEEED